MVLSLACNWLQNKKNQDDELTGTRITRKKQSQIKNGTNWRVCYSLRQNILNLLHRVLQRIFSNMSTSVCYRFSSPRYVSAWSQLDIFLQFKVQRISIVPYKVGNRLLLVLYSYSWSVQGYYCFSAVVHPSCFW